MLNASSRAWDQEERRWAHQQKPRKSDPIGGVILRDPLPDNTDNDNHHHQHNLINVALFINTIYTSFH